LIEYVFNWTIITSDTFANMITHRLVHFI